MKSEWSSRIDLMEQRAVNLTAKRTETINVLTLALTDNDARPLFK